MFDANNIGLNSSGYLGVLKSSEVLCQILAAILPGDKQQEEWGPSNSCGARCKKVYSNFVRLMVALAIKCENEGLNSSCPKLLD